MGIGVYVCKHIKVWLINRWVKQQCVLLKWASLPLVCPEVRICDPRELECQQVTMCEFKQRITV